jgi:hypothetical protein
MPWGSCHVGSKEGVWGGFAFGGVDVAEDSSEAAIEVANLPLYVVERDEGKKIRCGLLQKKPLRFLGDGHTRKTDEDTALKMVTCARRVNPPISNDEEENPIALPLPPAIKQVNISRAALQAPFVINIDRSARTEP